MLRVLTLARLGLCVAFAALVAAMSLRLPSLGLDGASPSTAHATNAPAWGWAAGTPLAQGCMSPSTWEATVSGLDRYDPARIPPMSLVVWLDGSIHKVDSRPAWEKAEHSDGTYWIIGSCRH